MGEFPARITAHDFVTPPEFAPWRLAPEGSGRIGGTRIELARCGAETRLAKLYEQIPVRVFPVDCGPTQPVLVYLANPTAGLMDGDAHAMQIHAGPDTRTVVTGQSATRVHPSVNGFCTQQWDITVADGAVLFVMPGPTIPFVGCRFFQRVRVHLGKNACFIWADLWFSGRYARGSASEQFRFDWIVQDMEVRRAGALVYRDRFAWRGPWTEETARWHFGGYPAVGSLFATGAPPLDIGDKHQPVALLLTAAGDCCQRWMGASEAVCEEVARIGLSLASAAGDHITGAPWLLSGNCLAGTHWFRAQEP
jgi:urease accessory protein